MKKWKTPKYLFGTQKAELKRIVWAAKDKGQQAALTQKEMLEAAKFFEHISHNRGSYPHKLGL